MVVVISDLTRLLIDEVRPLAEYFGKQEEYEASPDINYETIKEYARELLKDCNVNFIKSKISEANPNKGVIETVQLFRKRGGKFFIITDDPLLSISENKQVIQQKLNLDDIYTTSSLVLENGKCTGELTDYCPKDKIAEMLIKQHSSEKIICMVQGENDISLARATKRHGGYVFVVNSNSPKLREISDLYIKDIKDASTKIESFLKEKQIY